MRKRQKALHAASSHIPNAGATPYAVCRVFAALHEE